jgi:hypothetical protein
MKKKTKLPDKNPKTAEGIKKPRLGLIPPEAQIQEAKAFAHGADKYEPWNWAEERISVSIYVDAALRHLLKFQNREDVDPESGATHLGHVRACIGILIHALWTGDINDDRPPKKKSLTDDG